MQRMLVSWTSASNNAQLPCPFNPKTASVPIFSSSRAMARATVICAIVTYRSGEDADDETLQTRQATQPGRSGTVPGRSMGTTGRGADPLSDQPHRAGSEYGKTTLAEGSDAPSCALHAPFAASSWVLDVDS